MSDEFRPALYWDSAYAIAISLIDIHPNLDPNNVGLSELADLVESLPGFIDDPELVNERLLLDIINSWYEEITGL